MLFICSISHVCVRKRLQTPFHSLKSLIHLLPHPLSRSLPCSSVDLLTCMRPFVNANYYVYQTCTSTSLYPQSFLMPLFCHLYNCKLEQILPHSLIQ